MINKQLWRLGTLMFWAYWISLLALSGHASVVINEIMYRPGTLNNDHEFIELYNGSENETNMEGWIIDDGIHYVFPPGTRLAANSYLIVSPSPEVFVEEYGEFPNVYGPYTGFLNNGGEAIQLHDVNRRIVDKVLYFDEVGWPVEADGHGASIERKHPLMDSNQAASWGAGALGGTPGSLNQNRLSHPIPIITMVRHKPVVPTSNEAVTITARILHPYPLAEVRLYYRREMDSGFTHIMMDTDSHSVKDYYRVTIPAFPSGTRIEFYVEAWDEHQVKGSFPHEWGKTALYLVDDSEYSTDLPLYRIVMRSADELYLRTRSPYSNEELDATFIHGDDAYYNVGVRFRGKGSRGREPKSYRVNFSQIRHFGTIRKLNLNAWQVDRQFIGLECFKRLRLPASEKRFVSLVFNQNFVHDYIQVERTDKYMMQRLFGMNEGNLYRGVEQANLDYRGDDPNNYRFNYIKETNELEDDYQDIIELCSAFSNTTQEEFPREVSKYIHVQQWIRWFALKEVLNDLEGGLSKERGDDYYLYRQPGDGLFYILPWDLDSVFDIPFQPIHHHRVVAVQRLLRHPAFASLYYEELDRILNVELTQGVVDSIIDMTSPVADEIRRQLLKENAQAMREYILSTIPRKLSVQVEKEVDNNNILIAEGAEWRYFKGTEPPSSDPLGWIDIQFDDSSWLLGAGGFGYGDGDDRTLLTDMQNRYSTLFIRETFYIESPEKYSSLRLYVFVDDGFVAYLNGQEFARHNISGLPYHTSFADNPFEANQLIQLNFPQLSAWLNPGQNVLAVVGANTNLSSSDMTLNVRLDGIMKDGQIIRLSGTANPIHSQSIHVNGKPASYQAWIPAWEYSTPLEEGCNSFSIEAKNTAGEVIDSTYVISCKGTILPKDVDILHGDVEWSIDDNPIVIQKDFFVPDNASLSIDAGVRVLFAASSSLIVYGSMSIHGTANQPVVFQPLENGLQWDGIQIIEPAGHVEIEHAQFTNVSGGVLENGNRASVLNLHAASATIKACTFRESEVIGINAVDSYLAIASNTFQHMAGGIKSLDCGVLIENNTIQDVFGGHSAIALENVIPKAGHLRGNWIENIEGSGIVINKGDVYIEKNWIQACSDAALVLSGLGRSKIFNNILTHHHAGVVVKNGADVELIHNTIVNSATGVMAVRGDNVSQGGLGEIVNCVIWNSDQSLFKDADSRLEVDHSNLMQLDEYIGDGNFSHIPGFVDSEAYDYHLDHESLLIGAGRETEITEDFDGHPRCIDNKPDIGAFEYNSNTEIIHWWLFR